MNQSSRLLVVAVCAVVACVPAAVRANVYPTSLSQSANGINPANAETVTLSYLLNESATSVAVEVLNNSNSLVRTLTGATAKGVNSVVWDGKDNSNVVLPNGDYSFRVTSTGATRAGSVWTLISEDTALTDFEAPMGVGVNTNANSPYYGRVYIANGRSLATELGRTMTDALYMLNADLSDTNIAGGTGPHNGNITWSTVGDTTSANTPASPFRVQVGPDDSVYVADWSDGHSGLWQAPPDLSGTWTEVLDSTGRVSSGLNATHGSISDVIIEGTGANRKIYTIDEDFVPAGGSTGSILRYDIGTTPTFSGAPSGVAFTDGAAAPNNHVRNSHNSIARDPTDGGFWITQRAGETTNTTTWPADVSALIKVDASGNVVWRSVPDLQATSQADNFRGARGLAIDPLNKVMAVVTGHSNGASGSTGGGGFIHIIDLLTAPGGSGWIQQSFQFGSSTQVTNTDLAFDAAGNLYIANRTGEYVRTWSPPSGAGWTPNVFTTNSLAPLGSISLSSDVGLDGDHNDDNVVDYRDYVIWRVHPASSGGPDGYTEWAENYGGSNGTGAGSAVPEPMSAVLVVMGLFALGASRQSRS